MVSALPMICDSCALRTSPGTCMAFPDRIPLDAMAAETHYEKRPDQDNDLVYLFDPSKKAEQEQFLAFRHALLDEQKSPSA